MRGLTRYSGLWLSFLVVLGACRDECEIGDNSTCEGGLVCKENEDGDAACLPECDLNDPSTCQPNFICQPNAEGNPVCVEGCVPGDNTTCDLGFICGVNAEGNPACVEGCELDEDRCPANETCEPAPGAEIDPNCAPDVIFAGNVFDAANGTPIAGALVSAVDENGAAAGNVVATDANGNYRLQVFSIRAADGSGTPLQTYTLRVGAQNFQDFPFGARPALPIAAGEAVLNAEGQLVVDNTTNIAVDVALLKLPVEQQGFPSISGNAEPVNGRGGVLVVAEAAGLGFSTLTDLDGDYTIFNVPPNVTYTVGAFSSDVEYVSQDVALAAVDATGINLALSAAPTLTTINGDVNIVNAAGGSVTSVVLVVASTFDEITKRGQVPPGLRAPKNGAPNVTGAYTITGVPDGDYVALAAFENDALVRDPDPNIAGTQTLRINVLDGVITNLADNSTITTLPNFKVTQALEIIGLGSADLPEATSDPTPDLSWVDDSSEDEYELVVFDALGNLVFQTIIPGESGNNPVVTYAGTPLEVGMFYQFRVSSLKQGAPISQTEDLKGVFFFQP